MDDLIAAVKAKRELANLDDGFVRERIERVLQSDATIRRKYEDARDFKQFSRSKEFDMVLKIVRKELRKIYGMFQLSDHERLIKASDAKSLLLAHQSTQERLPFYDRIYKELANRIPSPKTVADLGCGMNPLSYAYMVKHGWKPELIASDLSRNDMLLLAKFFHRFSISGRTIAIDLTKDFDILDDIHADVIFLWKVLDSIEETNRHISYKLFEHLHAKWVVVSFPTMSLGGQKRISTRGRSWFERLLHRGNLAFETFSVENELFYVVRRPD